jgi:ABC-type uncharacterized transport system involved in gliding motility auxiliary subunit
LKSDHENKNMKKIKLQNLLRLVKLDKSSRDVVITAGLAGVVIMNLLITNISLRLDLSRGKAYSLSDSTVKIIKSMSDKTEIIFFVSDEVPTSFFATKRMVADLIREYQNISRSKMTVLTIDPKDDPKSETLASEYGVSPVEFSQMERDKFAVASGYFAIGVKVGDKKASIQRIDPSNLEYNITSLIYKLSQKEPQKVALIGLNGGFGMSGGESAEALAQVLGQQFEVIQGQPIDTLGKDTKTALIIESQFQKLDDTMIESLRSYLKNAGKAIVMFSGVDVGSQLQGATSESKLKSLVKDYGIEVRGDLALSTQSEIVNFSNDSNQRLLARYPLWLSTDVYNPDASYTSNIGYLTFPWVSTMTLTPKDNIIQKSIVRSTSNTWTISDFADLSPQSIQTPNVQKMREELLVAYAKSTKYNSELVVVPTALFAQDQFIGRSGNLEFVVNLTNEFASGGLLSGIRSRSGIGSRLPELSEAETEMYKWINILILPSILVILGVYKLNRRK